VKGLTGHDPGDSPCVVQTPFQTILKLTHFLFMDESLRQDGFALTGMSVSVADSARLRDTFYRELKSLLIQPEPGGPTHAVPLELKGSCLLPGLPDDQKSRPFTKSST